MLNNTNLFPILSSTNHLEKVFCKNCSLHIFENDNYITSENKQLLPTHLKTSFQTHTSYISLCLQAEIVTGRFTHLALSRSFCIPDDFSARLEAFIIAGRARSSLALMRAYRAISTNIIYDSPTQALGRTRERRAHNRP